MHAVVGAVMDGVYAQCQQELRVLQDSASASFITCTFTSLLALDVCREAPDSPVQEKSADEGAE